MNRLRLIATGSALSALVTITSCSVWQSSAEPRAKNTALAAPASPIGIHGPIDPGTDQTSIAFGMTKPGGSLWDTELELINQSDSPVVVDRVSLQSRPGIPNLTLLDSLVAPDPPRPLLTFIVHTPDLAMVPASGFGVAPAKPGVAAPVLALHIGPSDGPVSYNANVQVYYHDADGRRFAAIYFFRYLFCIKGLVTPKGCPDHVHA